MSRAKLTIDVVPQRGGDVRVRVRVGDKTFGRVCRAPENTADHVMAVVCAFMHPGQASPLRDELRAVLGTSRNPVGVPVPLLHDHGSVPASA